MALTRLCPVTYVRLFDSTRPEFRGARLARTSQPRRPSKSPKSSSSNVFLFKHFRTLVPPWKSAKHLESIASALFTIQRHGESPGLSLFTRNGFRVSTSYEPLAVFTPPRV